MSAGPVGLLVSEPARLSPDAARPALRLVATDGVLRSELLRSELLRSELLRSELLRSEERACLQAASAVRLTRRGRLVVTLVATITVAALALALAASVDAAAPQIDHATTVSAGQTLSEVAATQLPSLPIPDAVARIQLANDLSTSQVHAGQSLLIPVMP